MKTLEQMQREVGKNTIDFDRVLTPNELRWINNVNSVYGTIGVEIILMWLKMQDNHGTKD